jgi:hypothetical protein
MWLLITEANDAVETGHLDAFRAGWSNTVGSGAQPDYRRAVRRASWIGFLDSQWT